MMSWIHYWPKGMLIISLFVHIETTRGPRWLYAYYRCTNIMDMILLLQFQCCVYIVLLTFVSSSSLDKYQFSIHHFWKSFEHWPLWSTFMSIILFLMAPVFLFFNEKLLCFSSTCTTKIRQFHLIDICVWIIVIFIGSTLVNIVD